MFLQVVPNEVALSHLYNRCKVVSVSLLWKLHNSNSLIFLNYIFLLVTEIWCKTLYWKFCILTWVVNQFMQNLLQMYISWNMSESHSHLAFIFCSSTCFFYHFYINWSKDLIFFIFILSAYFRFIDVIGYGWF